MYDADFNLNTSTLRYLLDFVIGFERNTCYLKFSKVSTFRLQNKTFFRSSYIVYKSQNVLQVHVGMEASKPTKQDGNDTITVSHHPYILCHLATTYTNMLSLCLFVVGWVVVGVRCVLISMESGLCCG